MISQIKKFGGSAVIRLSPDYLRFRGWKVDDWIDIRDAVKVKPKKREESDAGVRKLR